MRMECLLGHLSKSIVGLRNPLGHRDRHSPRGTSIPHPPLPPPTMHLYNLTLQPPTSITHAIVGNFSGARHQEIIVSRGTRLDLLRVDMQTGKLSTILSTDAFGTIRSLAGFRLTGGTKGELSLVHICLFTTGKFTSAAVSPFKTTRS